MAKKASQKSSSKKSSAKTSSKKSSTRTSSARASVAKSQAKAVEPNIKFSERLVASLEEVNRIIEENKETLDAIQDIALQLTRVAGALEAIASKYAKKVDDVLESAMPILSNIPLVPEKTMDVITEIRDFARDIVKTCTTADVVIRDVEEGLMNADVSKLKDHKGELEKMTSALHKAIPVKN